MAKYTKAKLKKLTREGLIHEDSDRAAFRGVALVCAANVHNSLRFLLTVSFVDKKPVAREMLDGNGPLASFYAQIDAAFLTGLISADERRDLHLLRKVRNDFAHSNHHNLDFDTLAVRDRCMELTAYPDATEWGFVDPNVIRGEQTKAFERLNLELGAVAPKALDRFLNACAFLSLALILRAQRLTLRSEPASVTVKELRAAHRRFRRERSRRSTAPTGDRHPPNARRRRVSVGKGKRAGETKP